MTVHHCVAVDLGASSGRVMLARYETTTGNLTLREIHRFANGLHRVENQETWDVDNLEHHIRLGLARICDEGILIDSIGIDTWGVDFVLLDAQGNRVGLPVAYRDNRTRGIQEQACQALGRDAIYQRTGIQFLPFNTLYQLRALREQQPELLARVAHLLLIPDYLCYRLTGTMNWEYTNATTTQLVNINSDDWDDTLLAWAGVPRRWFGTPTHPGNVIGHWICPQHNRIPVVSVATHDTASAVIAAPLQDDQAAYLSSGTWSLMGFESQTPYTSPRALAANITNEGGAEGRYRVLKNIMGLWLLQRVCAEQQISDVPRLIEQARQIPACRYTIHPNDDRFINPESMSAEIQAACRESGQPVPQTAAELARCIFDSLALLYATVLEELSALRGRPFTHLHIVGGGSQNTLLNQLCADACGIPVLAGPVEASTLGNIGIQLMARDLLRDVDAFRQVVRNNHHLITYTPDPTGNLARFVARSQQNRHTKELCA
ncbi:rhamnulokinase [Shimwellia blattae]|uniref:Rhamnulokinase n=1 Tax=Shimwellia blattae (strain ATCC 29907 / DSM 4481 / JCM 1650 / NBRC 105725 / CDC 9005-74) TaxID=630626 RepID=I2B3W3_SHIBC|nr:rhamnulokinase [Shimwellia blattae]AFJ45217.1 rhamnulokinase [Shimwellia blattae DSM 4481 = NBRC 105725]GAB80669.1 rhamnulokinase [Shimwellia blattae DSM 4481 = NBRC 105725]VDY62694.1 Rhamnulokinase [Shimwellia blattae]VEC19454.1 Rhamnulokinase [Shimwellia blattae]